MKKGTQFRTENVKEVYELQQLLGEYQYSLMQGSIWKGHQGSAQGDF